MELRQIRYFIQVVQLGSVSKAARALNMAQPALSRHIQSLEHGLGASLLIRTTRGVVPTEAGAKLAELGTSLIGLMDNIRQQVGTSPKSVSGHVTIGMPQSVSTMLAPGLIFECQRRYPEISLRITEGLSIFLEEWLSQGKIDLAVLTRSSEQGCGDHTPLMREPMVLIGAPDRMPADRKSISLGELSQFPFIVAAGFRRLIEPWTARLGIRLNYTMEVDSALVIKEVVSKGLAYSIVPYGFVCRDLVNGDLGYLPLSNPVITRNLVMAANPCTTAVAASNVVRQILLELVADLEGESPLSALTAGAPP